MIAVLWYRCAAIFSHFLGRAWFSRAPSEDECRGHVWHSELLLPSGLVSVARCAARLTACAVPVLELLVCTKTGFSILCSRPASVPKCVRHAACMCL